VSLAGDGAPAKALAETPLVGKSSLFEGNVACVRIGRVADGLAEAVRGACQQLGTTNKLKGVILDLRFAGGDDYAAAAATADLFVRKEQPLLDWGNGVVRSKDKDSPIAGPVAVLVNRQTAGAAEALAAVLREAGAGLIFGGKTAGQAMIAQEFPLKNGERLRIASAPVRLGDGSVLSSEGVKPDITVEVSAQDERAYYADAFKEIPKAGLLASASPTNQVNGTNRTRRARFNEAELVRERKDGFNPDLDPAGARGDEPEKPMVQDPVLARALDVLKGLAVVRQSRS
jgi:C-terminal processing protease CtpA/Prc